MLLTIEQMKKLKYLVNDETGRASFVYADNGKASKSDLRYAIDMHETFTFAYGEPFIGNIDELKRRIEL